MQAEKKTGTGADEKASKTEEEVKVFDGDFVKVDQGTLFELILVRPHITPAIMTSKSEKMLSALRFILLGFPQTIRLGHGSLTLGMCWC